MSLTRRSLFWILPMTAGATAFGADNDLIASFAKTFAQLPAHSNGTNTFRPILNGMTSSGDHLEVHETTLAPGTSPHPPHRHKHEEMFLMIRGQLAVTIDGKTSVIGSGGVAYVSSNQLHGAHNPGTEPAQYFVVATGVS